MLTYLSMLPPPSGVAGEMVTKKFAPWWEILSINFGSKVKLPTINIPPQGGAKVTSQSDQSLPSTYAPTGV